MAPMVTAKVPSRWDRWDHGELWAGREIRDAQENRPWDGRTKRRRADGR